jgi:hypothetical protein
VVIKSRWTNPLESPLAKGDTREVARKPNFVIVSYERRSQIGCERTAITDRRYSRVDELLRLWRRSMSAGPQIARAVRMEKPQPRIPISHDALAG